jgi:uncharacterized membrane-anchored protein YitT (DUF2179 family)
VAVVMGVVMAFVILFLLKNTGVYNSGLSGLLQGVSRFVYVLVRKTSGNQKAADNVFNVLFWGLYLLANIPLIIFAWFKIGKTFTKLTLVFLVVNTLIGLGISFIPGINHVFIFGNTIPYGTGSESNIFGAYNVYNLPFYFNDKTGGHFFNTQYDSVKSLELLLYGVVYGIVSAVCYAMLYIVGGCSGGLDYVSIYYATKKQKSLGGMLTTINGFALLGGFLIGSYLSGGYIDGVG